MTLTQILQKCLKNINILIFALVLGLTTGYIITSNNITEYASIKIYKHDQTHEYKFDFYNKLFGVDDQKINQSTIQTFYDIFKLKLKDKRYVITGLRNNFETIEMNQLLSDDIYSASEVKKDEIYKLSIVSLNRDKTKRAIDDTLKMINDDIISSISNRINSLVTDLTFINSLEPKIDSEKSYINLEGSSSLGNKLYQLSEDDLIKIKGYENIKKIIESDNLTLVRYDIDSIQFKNYHVINITSITIIFLILAVVFILLREKS